MEDKEKLSINVLSESITKVPRKDTYNRNLTDFTIDEFNVET
jgi:hypothetical protein